MFVPPRMQGRIAAAVAVAALGLGLGACGSSSSSNTSSSSTSPSSSTSSGSGSTTSSSSSGNSTLSALKAVVQSHTSDPTHIAETVPISKTIPTGKKIAYINCGAPACTQMGESLTAAAKVLGWTVNDIVATPTPAGIQAAFQNAIALRPNAVVSDGFDAASYQHQIATLHSMHAYVVSNNGQDATGQNGIDLQTLPEAANADGNRLLADKVLVDDNLSGDIGEVLLSGYPIVAEYAQAFDSEVKSKCPKCTISTIQVDPTDIGSTSASKIATFLRIHPDIKQMYLTYDTLALGLSSAVKSAGVSFPKLYSWAVDDSGLAAAKAGQRAAVVPECYPEVGWTWADGLARLFTGQSVKPDESWAPFPIWSNDYHNFPASENNPPCNANYQSQFEALWHKS